ncbi:hypothetical protein CDR19_25410 [Ectopseudomonas toyotomiensis]|uniref:Transcriptional regulator, Middle operon regulator (Mor) family n=1 Tax=Ectopseudomonas toyotomiensis TaxID=554344 RepID=A0A1I5M3J0_9GAMM|nr:Mor transcription activator family protein [Pseudomonas toyotomiensis]PIA66154.1 hypothetical protein CDR19_25410 [Pseudomonas toyotomiensis]SFP04089.1 Transcriptional regulator, Middle operon regulator (Mor) family [Pseudomonas toyotomiensis]SFP97397.1 Transcriptional regulator, Middle operon regulator (Mor) family [Pseudomonas toyotomiensis]
MKVRAQQIRRRNSMLRELSEMVTVALVRNGADEAKAKNEAEDLCFQLHRRWRGITFTFPTRDELAHQRLKLHVVKEYNGSNADELVRKYSITEDWIYSVLREHQRRNANRDQQKLDLGDDPS